MVLYAFILYFVVRCYLSDRLRILVVFIVEDYQRPDDTSLTDDQVREIVIISDGLAGQLSFENARILYLNDNEGFHHLARKLQDKSLSVLGFKVVILLIGRGDVWETDSRFFRGVEATIREVKNQNERAILVLGATLPSTGDTRPMVRSFTFRNDKLAARCTADPRLEHARPGKHLLGPRGPVEDYYDGDGNINELGSDVIARMLERKLFSARLFQRWENPDIGH